MLQQYKRKYAFISYSHKDERIAKWLQSNLEAYRLPVEVVNEFENTRYLRPVFRDRTDLNSGKLSEELRMNLESSKFLIVLCSSNSADSFWVNEEIRTFIGLGQVDKIIPVLVDGGQQESLPYSLKEYYSEHPEDELLSVDLYSEGKEVSLIRIVSRMLSLEFNVLWDRHKRYKRRKFILLSSASVLALGLIYWFGAPLSLHVRIHDEMHNLPYPQDAFMTVGNAEYKLDSMETCIHISSLPGYMRLKTIPINVRATFYRPYSIDVRLCPGVSNEVTIQLSRDDTFSIFSGTVFDQEGNVIEGAAVHVNSMSSITDASGHFSVRLPIGMQDETQVVRVCKEGYSDYVRVDECPGTNLGYILR